MLYSPGEIPPPKHCIVAPERALPTNAVPKRASMWRFRVRLTFLPIPQGLQDSTLVCRRVLAFLSLYLQHRKNAKCGSVSIFCVVLFLFLRSRIVCPRNAIRFFSFLHFVLARCFFQGVTQYRIRFPKCPVLIDIGSLQMISSQGFWISQCEGKQWHDVEAGWDIFDGLDVQIMNCTRNRRKCVQNATIVFPFSERYVSPIGLGLWTTSLGARRKRGKRETRKVAADLVA